MKARAPTLKLGLPRRRVDDYRYLLSLKFVHRADSCVRNPVRQLGNLCIVRSDNEHLVHAQQTASALALVSRTLTGDVSFTNRAIIFAIRIGKCLINGPECLFGVAYLMSKCASVGNLLSGTTRPRECP